ncbi:hypothetical protein [Leifsonia sp. Leaf264]|uniref:hypothetical protein n=1 Tax=Leifsonia sp. Leaf264 TaxID=1736314 RepID=UPI0006F72D6F|nr:hypothetical protein [Leifsonia sp. Leaf264]
MSTETPWYQDVATYGWSFAVGAGIAFAVALSQKLSCPPVMPYKFGKDLMESDYPWVCGVEPITGLAGISTAGGAATATFAFVCGIIAWAIKKLNEPSN